MIGRLVWVGVGAAAGFLALRRLGMVSQPPGEIAGKAAGAVGGRVASLAGAGLEQGARRALTAARDFAAEVRVLAAEREAQLRAAMAADTDDDAGLDGRPVGRAADLA